jgi:hypothetical protein
MIKLGKLLKEAIDVSWNPFEENLNTWEKYTKLCAQRMASHMNLDDEFNVAEVSSRGVRDEEVGEMTAREALDYYIGMCQEAFNDDIEKMFEYWEDFANIDSAYDMEALVDAALYMEDPSSYILDISEDSSLELQPLKNDSGDLDEALDVSWNPYEETNDPWWYSEEGDGVNWDAIMDAIKAAANKVVGENAPNRSSYFNVWYDVLKWHAEAAWENLGDDDEDIQDNEVEDACRGAIKFTADPSNWDRTNRTKRNIIDMLDGYKNIVADKETLANLQNMGVFIHKMLSSKHKPSLSEALDVSWNPYGEDQYQFKVGDKARESDGDQELCKILDRRPDWNGVIKNPIDKAYINNSMWMYHDNEIDNEPWYLVQWLEHNSEKNPQWYPEADLGVFVPTNEALDVSWNPFEAWKDKYTENSWLKIKLGSRGEFEDADIMEIPNIKEYLLNRKKGAYKELLNDLKRNNVDEEDREGEIAYFNEFVGPFKMDKEDSNQWGYGLGEEDHEMYYRIFSNKYSDWMANTVATYGVDFADQITNVEVDELDNL